MHTSTEQSELGQVEIFDHNPISNVRHFFPMFELLELILVQNGLIIVHSVAIPHFDSYKFTSFGLTEFRWKFLKDNINRSVPYKWLCNYVHAFAMNGILLVFMQKLINLYWLVTKLLWHEWAEFCKPKSHDNLLKVSWISFVLIFLSLLSFQSIYTADLCVVKLLQSVNPSNPNHLRSKTINTLESQTLPSSLFHCHLIPPSSKTVFSCFCLQVKCLYYYGYGHVFDWNES